MVEKKAGIHKTSQKVEWFWASFLNQQSTKLKPIIMGNLLYVAAVVLIILWAIGYLGYNAGAIIHILLVIALISILLRLIQGKKVV